MNNREKIINYIREKNQVTPHEVVSFLGIGNAMVHRYLKELVEKGVLVKQGTAPRVFYKINPLVINLVNHPAIQISQEQKTILQENFTLILPDGQEFEGYTGFVQWCNQRNFDVQKKTAEFVKTINGYAQFKKGTVIDATQKITATFPAEKRFLDHLYFLHPYSLPVFGKTKIATWLFHGKQTQNKMLMRRVLEITIPKIKEFLKREKYDAVAFVPPSVPRETQFMKQLEQSLSLSLPVIKIEKIKNPIIIQQKSLKDLNDRIENASSTLVVTTNGTFKKVLIIDDFTGSGSTLNIVTEKMKHQQVSRHVDGLTITGSMNGFEVIKEI